MPPFRGRGRGGFRGRGRGRGGARRGQRDTFTKARVEDPLSGSESSDVEDGFDEHIQSEPEEDTSSDEEEEIRSGTTSRPYSALLQSLQESSSHEEPKKKRRKLDHQPAPQPKLVEEDELEAEEPEEPEDDEVPPEEEIGADDDDEEDMSDPFEAHFARPGENDLAKKLKAISENLWETRKLQLQGIGRCAISTPGAAEPVKKAVSSPDQLKLKKKLASTAKQIMPEFNDVQKGLAASLFAYQDILFGARTVKNAESLRQITCLHALNHIYKTRDRVIKNNARLAKEQDSEEAEVRDQGFTRPKVLMLLETRQSCVRAVDTLIKLCEPEQQENKKRFQDTYTQEESRFGEDKPEDFRELFEGNDDNEFRMGLKFTRKTVKFFSQFYNSDIIFASPLGLRRAIEHGGEKKKQDYDFLSSVELVIVDQADAMLMQNWEHVEYCFSHLNLQPKDAHGCDFSRVRTWYLDNQAAHLRQTVVLSAYLAPELNALYNKYMRNLAGKAKITPEYEGAMLDLGISIKQTFTRFDSPNPAADPDARFKHFSTAIVPSLTRLPKPAAADGAGGPGVLVFIPSYLDFVRVRNYFASSAATQNISFGAVSEYSEPADMRRARSHFLSGRHAVLLYTGRAHHFRRFLIRGVRRVVLYGLPENPAFYREIVGEFLGASIAAGAVDPSEVSVRALFSKWDGLALERIVGTKRVAAMIREKSGDTFDFV